MNKSTARKSDANSVSLRLDINQSTETSAEERDEYSLCFENMREKPGRKTVLLEVDSDSAYFIKEALVQWAQYPEKNKVGMFEDWLVEEACAVLRRAWPEIYDIQKVGNV